MVSGMWGEAQLLLGVHQASSNDYVHIMEMENEKKKKKKQSGKPLQSSTDYRLDKT